MNEIEESKKPRMRVSANRDGANNLELVTYARDIESGATPEIIKEHAVAAKEQKKNRRREASIRDDNGGRATSTDLSIGAEGFEF